MTCIVGLKTQHGVFLGSDSAATDENGLQTILTASKVFLVETENTEILVGGTTSTRMLQLLQYDLERHLQPYKLDDEDVMKYLSITFINGIRECLKQGGFARKEDEQEKGGHLLVGFQGRLFEIEPSYQIFETTTSYEAIGSGREIALGSLYMSSYLESQQRILQALEAASQHNAYVRPPYTLLYLAAR